MESIRRFLNQRKIQVLLLALLVVSVALNGYLFTRLISPLQEERGEEETYAWIEGYVSQMWTLAIKLTPNKAVFYSSDRQFNVSVKASYWEPLQIGNRTFYVKVFDKKIDPVEEPPKLVKEKAVIVYKSPEDYSWKIPIFNFTFTLDTMERGIHLFSVVGDTRANFTSNYGCIATFAIKFAWGIGPDG